MQNIGKWARPTRQRAVDAVVLIIPAQALRGLMVAGKRKKTGWNQYGVGGSPVLFARFPPARE